MIHFNEKLFTQKVNTAGSIMLEANLCRLSDQSLFMSWTCGGTCEPCEENITCFSKSYDNGRTWDDSTVLFSHPQKGIFTPEVMVVDGKIIAFPCSYYNHTTFSQDCHSYISVSEDCSKSFTPPASIGNAINNIHTKGHLVIGKKIIVSCSWVEGSEDSWASFANQNKKCIVCGKEYLPENFTTLYHSEYCGVLISEDGGSNWRISGKIGFKGGCFVEPAIVQLSDGTLVMLMRRNRETWLYESRSYDLGESWSEIRRTDIPSAVVKVDLTRDSKGRIYLLNSPNHERKRSPLSLWISDDDMKTWGTKVDLMWSDTEPLAYPDAFIDEERGLLCFGWDDRKNIYYSEYPIY